MVLDHLMLSFDQKRKGIIEDETGSLPVPRIHKAPSR
jgi:hypothetical protein